MKLAGKWETVEDTVGMTRNPRVRQKEKYDVIIMDIKMPKMDGIEALERLQILTPETPVVMISGHGNIETAVRATKLGAFDFMEKPLERERVLLVLRNALERRRLEETVREYQVSTEERYRLVGSSAALSEIQQAVARIAPTKASVLITGESGTGKELVAKAIHDIGPRKHAPFVKVNCAALTETLLESELFGHVKGAFTGADRRKVGRFELAGKGTIFLDEIGDLPLELQPKILRVLQEGEFERIGNPKTIKVNVRIIAATNRKIN